MMTFVAASKVATQGLSNAGVAIDKVNGRGLSVQNGLRVLPNNVVFEFAPQASFVIPQVGGLFWRRPGRFVFRPRKRISLRRPRLCREAIAASQRLERQLRRWHPSETMFSLCLVNTLACLPGLVYTRSGVYANLSARSVSAFWCIRRLVCQISPWRAPAS